jgi:hypothetical protein
VNAELACVNSIRPTDFENSIFFFFFFLFHLPLLLERELKGITINKRVTKYIRAERKVKNGPKAARNGEESTFF